MWIAAGLGIGLSISLLVHFGIMGLLLLLNTLNLAEQEILIFSCLFYAVVFFIARSGVRVDNRRNRDFVTRQAYEEHPPTKRKVAIGRIKTVLWVTFGCIAIGWITPVLLIYWSDPQDPEWAITASIFIFTSAAAVAFFLKNDKKIKSTVDRITFFIGAGLGAISVVCFF